MRSSSRRSTATNSSPCSKPRRTSGRNDRATRSRRAVLRPARDEVDGCDKSDNLCGSVDTDTGDFVVDFGGHQVPGGLV
ncbi:hypothetical protein C9J85_12090 [Haloferax sp. wsp5]|nr:hypothetical protein C9J85_12090 [Haloferax sp. wsp5]